MAKNKTIIALFLMILCVVLSYSVSALSVGSVTASAIQGESYKGSFILTNDEAVNITSITLIKGVLTSGTDTISTGDININPRSVSELTVGESTTIEYDIEVDYKQETGTYTGKVDITYTNGTVESASADITFSVLENPNKLRFKDIDIEIDNDKSSVDEGDDFDIKPGELVELTVEVENMFTRDEDVTIEDVEICVYNDDLDWDECEDIGDIKDGKEESYTFTFTIEYDIDEDDSPFTIEVSAEGEDENGNDHSDFFEFELDLDKERDEVKITNMYFSPSIVSCQEQSVRLKIELINTGSDDQTRAVLEILSNELDFEKYIRSIDLDEGDRDDFDVIIPLDDVERGEVYVTVNAYATSDEDDLTSIETLAFMVTCDDEEEEEPEVVPEEEEEEDDSNMEILVPVIPTQTTGSVVQTSLGQKKSFISGNDGLYITLLILIAVLLLVLIFVLTANLMHKKKN